MYSVQPRHTVNKAPILIGIIVMLVIGVLALPTKQRCGAPGLTCATTLDKHGYVHYYYEVEPVGVYLAEMVTGSNIRVFYRTGEDLEKVR